MSHVDKGIGRATCQSCRESVRSGRLGTVRRHRNASGLYCLGGGGLSLENATPMTPEQVAALVASFATQAGA